MEPGNSFSIGTCAWSFDDWRGVFYPESLPPAQRLHFYADHLNAVEIDSTFYSPPAPMVARHWLEATPESFVFTCKMPKEITHLRKFRQCEEELEQFLASIEPLRPKLACILIQLPPYFSQRQDEFALKQFLLRLPKTFRFAVEFRDHGWHLPRIAHFLEEHDICWVWNDTSPIDRQNEAAFDFIPRTTDFLYVRLLGDLATKYRQDGDRVFRYRKIMWPRDAAIESWVVKIQQHLSEVSRVLIYVNNHFEGFSPVTCQKIAQRLGLPIRLPELQSAAPVKKAQGAQMELGF